MTTSAAPTAGQHAQDIPAPAYAAETQALSISGVNHSYGPRHALIDINFTVAPASFTALLGLNGAGKSTLFALVTRLFGIQAGQIGIFGHDIGLAPSEALRLLGVVFQPRTLDLDLSVTQNLLYHAALHGIGRRDARLRSGEVLTRIGLADRAGSQARDLSTHLFDEIAASDDLVVLHQGRILAQGPVARVIAETGADNVNAAFMRLTGAAAPTGSPAP